MKLQLKRIFKGPNYTIGKLSINGQEFCDTLEDTVRVLVDKNKDGDFDEVGEGKIYGKTAIPAGTYEIELNMSSRFKKILPHIMKVPGFEGIRIHSGNTAESSSGCVLCGINNVKGQVTKSRETMAKLMKQLKSVVETEHIYITIE